MKGFFHIIGLGSLAAVLCVPAVAGEYAVLANGFRLHADRHEIDGTTVRLHDGEGVTELPVSTIANFEPDGQPAPVAQPAPSFELPAPVAPIPPPKTPQELAAQAAKKYELPESFVKSVMHAESNFRPDAVSPKGATGLMQLMPGTAKQLGADPKDPAQNAEAGTQYLRALLAKYENDPNQVMLALAAYNAGPGAVEKYQGVPPYRETREYILRVLKDWQQSGNK